MPHAVILGAKDVPPLPQLLLRDGKVIHKVLETIPTPWGWLLRSLVLDGGAPTPFFARVDRRDDGLVVRLDDHMHVERGPLVFDHLALVAKRILEAEPAAKLGPTNLADRIARGP